MNELALFAGGGGGILGGKLLGWRTRCAVEIDAYARSILLARQRDGFLEPFPVWDNIETFDGKPWRGHIEVVSGGFPCVDISVAKTNAKGIEGDRSGLWKHMARIVYEVMPRFVFVENSPALTVRGLGVVLRDLAELGYDARWGVLGACHTGLPHKRHRIWIMAYTKSERLQVAPFLQAEAILWESGGVGESPGLRPSQWQVHQPRMDGVDNGVGNWVGRAKAIGNGQCPSVVALAWRLLGGPATGSGIK